MARTAIPIMRSGVGVNVSNPGLERWHHAACRWPRQSPAGSSGSRHVREAITSMASLTVENYVKTIYQLIGGQEGHAASTGQIATALGVAPGTVTSMLKTLDAAQLAAHRPYEGVVLTPAGQALALRILRRHRLIELFLMRTLGMSWDEVHDEAEHMEHAVSDLLVERIDAYLGRPDVDPHGDPIPRTDGRLREVPPTRCLADCGEGEAFTLARVLDQSSEFLRYLTESGLTLGATGTVTRNPDGAGLMLVEMEHRSLTLSLQAATNIVVSETT